MNMNASKVLTVLVALTFLTGMAVAEETSYEEIPTAVVGQELDGTLSVTEDMYVDWYWEDFHTVQPYGQWAVLEVEGDTVNEEDQVIESGEWADLSPAGYERDGNVENPEDAKGVETITHSNDFTFSSYETGQYAFVVTIAKAESQYTLVDEDVESFKDVDGLHSGHQWEAPENPDPRGNTEFLSGQESYDSVIQTEEGAEYGISEISRDEFLFEIIEADEPDNVVESLTQFWSNSLLPTLVDTFTGFFQDANIGVPDPQNPPEF